MLREGVPSGMIVSTAKEFSRDAYTEVEAVGRRLEGYSMEFLSLADIVELLRLQSTKSRAHPWRDFGVSFDIESPEWEVSLDWVSDAAFEEHEGIAIVDAPPLNLSWSEDDLCPPSDPDLAADLDADLPLLTPGSEAHRDYLLSSELYPESSLKKRERPTVPGDHDEGVRGQRKVRGCGQGKPAPPRLI